MFEPAIWQDDPPCGHRVAHPFQTHYCTYIRAPRLLTLQCPLTSSRSEMLFLAAHQTFELWFKVILADLRAAAGTRSDVTLETTKLLQRDVRLLRLLIAQADLVETVLLTNPGRQLTFHPVKGVRSRQFDALDVALRSLEEEFASAPADDVLSNLAELRLVRGYFSERFTKLLSLAPGHNGYTRDEYLQLDVLLTLQDGPKDAWTPVDELPQALAASEPVGPDQLMFIVVHQAFEIWFRVLLEHIDEARLVLLANPPNVPRAVQVLQRVVGLQRFLRDQISIPTTMLPMDFLKFRDETKTEGGVTYRRGLAPSSGTESYQFREVEIASGLRQDEGYLALLHGADGMNFQPLTERQRQRLQEPTLAEAFATALRNRGVDNVDDIFAPADVHNPMADLQQLADLLLEYDEYFRFWRLSHVSMVERMIGGKSGTGDFGPEYLKETVGVNAAWRKRMLAPSQQRPRFFESLWEARTRMKPTSAA